MERSPAIERNVTFYEDTPRVSREDSATSRRKWISRSNRAQTDLQEALVDSRPGFQHQYLFKRPRALHYRKVDDSSETSSSYPLADRRRTNSSVSMTSSTEDSEERSTEDLHKQIARLDLFVDLVWVGSKSHTKFLHLRQI